MRFPAGRHLDGNLESPETVRWVAIRFLSVGALPDADVDGPVAARISRLRLLVELHMLAFAELVERAALHRGAVEDDPFRGALWLDDAESAIPC